MSACVLRFILPALLMVLPMAASACPVCFGAPGSQENEAIGWAILLLLAIVFGVLGGIVAFAVYLMRRANNPLPDHSDLLK